MTIDLKDIFKRKREENAKNRREKTSKNLDELTAKRLEKMIQQQDAGLDLNKTLNDLLQEKGKNRDG